MDLSIKYGNLLLVNGEFMRGENPDYVRRVLEIGRSILIQALDMQYEKMVKQAPEVQRGSIWLMNLAQEMGSIILPELIAAHKNKQSNRYVFSNTNIELVQPAYRPYWHVVHEAKLIPEVREAVSGFKELDGFCLLVRDTPLID